ncbi:hypothetical protein KIL84_011161 [Mauremys mutica]|uniref:Fibronectin type-III domain-containing protein n=1 Tax=Mauremys mutica TaxID=74926 RepID=A0A9D3X943_9SAUR|nr:hypothetical protein KIL84_011161 [Mauremys mutica]
MAGSADTIVMPALGRPFQLGMLYDCRSDSLIPVTKPGLSESSDVSDPVKTLSPTSPPGKPVITAVESSAIALTWESPSVIGDGVVIKEYKVEYKEEAGDTSQEGKEMAGMKDRKENRVLYH